MNAHIDNVLAPVAEVCRSAADDILDLRRAALMRSDPGECLQCYFKIFDVLEARDTGPLQRLRRWLETHLEVVARDQHARELERLPVSLHQDDLESFCREMINEFRENRAYAGGIIELSLDFRGTVAA